MKTTIYYFYLRPLGAHRGILWMQGKESSKIEHSLIPLRFSSLCSFKILNEREFLLLKDCWEFHAGKKTFGVKETFLHTPLPYMNPLVQRHKTEFESNQILYRFLQDANEFVTQARGLLLHKSTSTKQAYCSINSPSLALHESPPPYLQTTLPPPEEKPAAYRKDDDFCDPIYVPIH